MSSDMKELIRKYVGQDDNMYNVMLQRLLRCNKSINLHCCVQMTCEYDGSTDFLEFYLAYCDNINVVDFRGRTALHIACYYVHLTDTFRTIQILINAGSSINLQDNFGYTAMHIASQYYDINYATRQLFKNAIKLLILADADIFNLKNNLRQTVCDYFTTELLEYFQIDKAAKTIGIKTGRLTKAAKK